MRRAVLLLVLLAGCARGTPAPSPSLGSTPVPVPATTSPAPSPPPPPERLLPVELGGVELHTFAVGTDILERLATTLGVASDALEVRYASDHGARFLQMYAVRLPGTESAALADAWAQVAYPSVVTDVERSEETVGGRVVTVVHSPATAPRLGTFYLFVDAETLRVVQAFDPAVAAEAIQAMPQG